ncbi:hypothetical protein NL676_028704 [Syzygium grande]|nr:hypothetical protein NL676_028704 [Syzygium grande]
MLEVGVLHLLCSESSISLAPKIETLRVLHLSRLELSSARPPSLALKVLRLLRLELSSASPPSLVLLGLRR